MKKIYQRATLVAAGGALALMLIPAAEAGAAIKFLPVLTGTVTCNQSLGVWSGSIRFTPPLFNGGSATTEKMTVNASLGNSASPCVTTSGIAVDGAIKGTADIHRLGCQQVLQGLQWSLACSDFHLEIQAHLGCPTGGADKVEAAPCFLRCGCTGHDQLDGYRRKGHRLVRPVRDPERHALRLGLGRGGPAGLRIDCRSRQPHVGNFSRHLVVLRAGTGRPMAAMPRERSRPRRRDRIRSPFDQLSPRFLGTGRRGAPRDQQNPDVVLGLNGRDARSEGYGVGHGGLEISDLKVEVHHRPLLPRLRRPDGCNEVRGHAERPCRRNLEVA